MRSNKFSLLRLTLESAYVLVSIKIDNRTFFFHLVAPIMELKPNCGSDRAWVWSTPADFADQEPKPELLAIRFRDSESKLIIN